MHRDNDQTLGQNGRASQKPTPAAEGNTEEVIDDGMTVTGFTDFLSAMNRGGLQVSASVDAYYKYCRELIANLSNNGTGVTYGVEVVTSQEATLNISSVVITGTMSDGSIKVLPIAIEDSMANSVVELGASNGIGQRGNTHYKHRMFALDYVNNRDFFQKTLSILKRRLKSEINFIGWMYLPRGTVIEKDALKPKAILATALNSFIPYVKGYTPLNGKLLGASNDNPLFIQVLGKDAHAKDIYGRPVRSDSTVAIMRRPKSYEERQADFNPNHVEAEAKCNVHTALTFEYRGGQRRGFLAAKAEDGKETIFAPHTRITGISIPAANSISLAVLAITSVAVFSRENRWLTNLLVNSKDLTSIVPMSQFIPSNEEGKPILPKNGKIDYEYISNVVGAVYSIETGMTYSVDLDLGGPDATVALALSETAINPESEVARRTHEEINTLTDGEYLRLADKVGKLPVIGEVLPYYIPLGDYTDGSGVVHDIRKLDLMAVLNAQSRTDDPATIVAKWNSFQDPKAGDINHRFSKFIEWLGEMFTINVTGKAQSMRINPAWLRLTLEAVCSTVRIQEDTAYTDDGRYQPETTHRTDYEFHADSSLFRGADRNSSQSFTGLTSVGSSFLR